MVRTDVFVKNATETYTKAILFASVSLCSWFSEDVVVDGMNILEILSQSRVKFSLTN